MNIATTFITIYILHNTNGMELGNYYGYMFLISLYCHGAVGTEGGGGEGEGVMYPHL